MNRKQLISEVGKYLVDNTHEPQYQWKIKELEKNGTKVVHVIPKHTVMLGWDDKVEFEEYLLIFKEDFENTEQFLEDFYIGYIYAWVENYTWKEMGSEYGRIGIQFNADKTAKRLM